MRNKQILTKVDQAVTMRAAGPGDRPAIERLAALDSQRAPKGDVLVAEVGGELRAAVTADGQRVIADPFRPTGDVVTLLRERVAQVADRPHRGLSGFRLARAA